MEDDEPAVRLEPRGHGPLHVPVVEDVDVLVDDRDLLHRGVGPEGRHDRVLPVPLVLLADRHDAVEPCAPALREADRLHVGDRAGDGLVDHGLAGHPHEQEVLVGPADDDVEDGPVHVVDSVHDEDGLLPHPVVRADRVHEGSLRVGLLREAALEDVLRVRGDREAVPEADHVDGPPQGGMGQGRRDPRLVHSILDGRPAREEAPGVQADAHGDLELLPRLHRLVVHVPEVARDDPARAPAPVEDLNPVEGQVPDAVALRDPDARGDETARVPRVQLRDGGVEQVDVVRGVLLEGGVVHDARVLRVGLGLEEPPEELVPRDLEGRGDPVPRGPDVRGGLEPVEVREVHGDVRMGDEVLRELDLAAHASLDRDRLVGESFEPRAEGHGDSRRRKGGSG